MRIATTSLIATASLACALTARGTAENPPASPPARQPASPSDKAGAEAATASPTMLGPAAKAAAREAAGLPPEPDAATAAAYIAALDAIDKDIVHGEEEKAISRGLDTCSTYVTRAGHALGPRVRRPHEPQCA
ncbi:hypothetical protein ACF1BN_21640 [Streptomyces sp. NPDC014861]|uniref:hypothetical protein n=1 Tax=Streptomyces sp. NPDC014861 TaxID=3364923 RepID=UPI0036FDA891